MARRPISLGWLPGPAASTRSILTQDVLLGKRLFLYGLARYIVATLIVVGALVASLVIGVEELNVLSLAAVAAFMAVYNWVIFRLSGRDPAAAIDDRIVRRRRIALAASIGLDFLSLAVAAWFVGGARSPFIVFFLFHIVIASLFLTRRAAFTCALAAVGMVAVLIIVEVSGTAPPPFPAGAVPSDGPLDPRYAVALLVVYSGLFLLVAASQTHVAASLREAEAELQRRAEEARSVSAMRRDFLMVALHDVGGPVGAASSLLRNLNDGLCGPVDPGHRAQVARALAKLEAVQDLVRDLRTLGELETTNLESHSTEVSLTFLLLDVVDEHAEGARSRRQTLVVDGSSPPALVYGVPRLLREAIANYVANAIKYTPDAGSILCRVRTVGEAHRVEVTDNGPGICESDRARLFEEFVRVGRERAGERRIGGTGLGLSIVRRIVAAHAGSVGVESEIGRGSTFWMEVPACTGAEGADSSPKV